MKNPLSNYSESHIAFKEFLIILHIFVSGGNFPPVIKYGHNKI